MLFSKSFIVSGLIFRSLIHFEFIFVSGVRECSNFILLHVAVQFSQHHLLKRLSFLHCIFLPPLIKNKVTICAWVYLWAFYPVALMYISVFVPVPYSLFLKLLAPLIIIYLFILAVLGLCFCARASSSCGRRGPLFIAVRGPLTIMASLVAEHRIQTRRLSSCGSRA